MKIQKMFYGVLVALLLVAGFQQTGFADEEKKTEEPKPFSTVSVGFFSQYIWRGYESSKDSMVVQPSITVGYAGFDVTLWGNLDTDDKYTNVKKTNMNETDLTLEYTYDAGPVKLIGGYIFYAFESVDDAQELFLKIAGNCLLSPTLSIYREFAHYPGWYLNLSVSHSINLTKEITLDLGASLGYQASDTDKIVKYDDNLNPTGDKYRALHDGQFSLGLTIPFAKYFSCKPMVAYSVALSNDAQNRIKGTSLSAENNFFYGGVSFAAAF
jgi:hypothetical protein